MMVEVALLQKSRSETADNVDDLTLQQHNKPVNGALPTAVQIKEVCRLETVLCCLSCWWYKAI